jgi:hypothetical protein
MEASYVCKRMNAAGFRSGRIENITAIGTNGC